MKNTFWSFVFQLKKEKEHHHKIEQKISSYKNA